MTTVPESFTAIESAVAAARTLCTSVEKVNAALITENTGLKATIDALNAEIVKLKAQIPPPPVALAAFGVGMGGGWGGTGEPAMKADIAGVKAAGGTYFRHAVQWSVVEKTPGVFDLNWAVSIAEWIRQGGLKYICQLVYCPTFYVKAGAPGGIFNPPADLTKWEAFVRAVVTRLKGLVPVYEIWNEPNIKNFWTVPNPVTYVAMLRIAFKVIRELDPAALVITAGLSPASDNAPNIAPPTFVKAIYSNGGKGLFDGVGLHPYMGVSEPDVVAPWATTTTQYDAIRATMDANGDNAKLIWGTEFGYATAGPAGKFVSEAEQARLVQKQITFWRTKKGAGPLINYLWRDLSTGTADAHDRFGMTHVDGSPKPVVAAVRKYLTGA